MSLDSELSREGKPLNLFSLAIKINLGGIKTHMKRYFTGTQSLSFVLVMGFSVLVQTPAQTKPSHLPNLKKTPGATVKVKKDDLCGSWYETADGSISISLKRKVFDLYGIRTEQSTPLNIDHLIPVGLGGSNSIENLWPQPLSGEWNYSQKNRLERRLRKLVCRGELDLEKAQQEISSDWVSAYKKYLTKPDPSKRD